MPFKPGQSGNPLGRAKYIDPRSPDLQDFCTKYRDDIRKVGEIALERAIVEKEPWAIKLCMEYFYPKPGTFVAISKEETKDVTLSFVNALSHEDQQTFLKLWIKSKNGNPAFSEIDTMPKQGSHNHYTINNSEETNFIDINTVSGRLD